MGSIQTHKRINELSDDHDIAVLDSEVAAIREMVDTVKAVKERGSASDCSE